MTHKNTKQNKNKANFKEKKKVNLEKNLKN